MGPRDGAGTTFVVETPTHGVEKDRFPAVLFAYGESTLYLMTVGAFSGILAWEYLRQGARITIKDASPMRDNTSLVGREQTAYLQYHGDGMVDILVGLWAVGFGLWMLVENVVFIALLPIFFLPAWRSHKESTTAPRMRHIEFTPDPNARRNLMAIMLVGVLALEAREDHVYLSEIQIDPSFQGRGGWHRGGV